MIHTRLSLPLACGILLLVGFGCTKDAPIQTTPPIPVATPEQQAYTKCLQAGYTPQIITDDTGQHFFCDINENMRCTQSEILDDSCFEAIAQAEKSQKEPITDDTQPRACEPVADPVCGKDNRTYTNECIAKQYAIDIAHTGACTPEEQPNILETLPSIPKIPGRTQTNRNQPNAGTPSVVQPLPDWINTALFLAKQESSGSVNVQQCNIGKNTYYLIQPTVCPTCFKTVYSNEGYVLCHPNHDIAGTCPAQDLNTDDPVSCQLVYTLAS